MRITASAVSSGHGTRRNFVVLEELQTGLVSESESGEGDAVRETSVWVEDDETCRP